MLTFFKSREIVKMKKNELIKVMLTNLEYWTATDCAATLRYPLPVRQHFPLANPD